VVEQAVFGSRELTCLICRFVLQRLELNNYYNKQYLDIFLPVNL